MKSKIRSSSSSLSSSSSSSSPNITTTSLESLFALDSNKPADEILSSISYCTSFADQSPSSQEFKRDMLVKLLSLLINPPHKSLLDEQVIVSATIAMVSANLFRPLPPPPPPPLYSDFEEDIVSNPSKEWPSLQIVYEILSRVITSAEPKTLTPHLDDAFLTSLLSLFQSDDPRERECLKNVYHRVYLRFPSRRAFMRRSMVGALLDYISEETDGGVGAGVGDLLEIWGSVIDGFAVPVKEEHRVFLMRVLVPLHKSKGVRGFHRQLAYCVCGFVRKEGVVGGVVVRGLLRYWPLADSHKEVLLIGELEEVVESVDTDQYRKLALPLCTHITRCLNSWNSQVAERALYVWNNEHFVKMALTAIEEVFPVVVEGIEKNLKWHWSKSVRQLTENVKSMLEEMEPVVYSECLQEINRRESTAHKAEIKRKERWDRIEIEATKNYPLLQQKQQQSSCVCVSN